MGVAPVARVMDEDMKLVVPLEGGELFRCTEGVARSRFGIFGFNPVVADKIFGMTPKIFLYGDSFVEALQVQDEFKPDAVMSRHLGGVATTFGIGRSGAGLKSFIMRAQGYERAFGRPVCHVFFIASVRDDLFHDQGGVVDGKCQLAFSNFASRFHLNVLLATYTIGRSLKNRSLHLFHLSCSKETPVTIECRDVLTTIQFFVGEIKEKISAPVLIVYCPNVPRIHKGEVVFLDDEAQDALVLKGVVENSGIGYLDITPALVNLWENKKVFARGFANAGGPGSGHLNEEGIEAVFGAVADEVRTRYGL